MPKKSIIMSVINLLFFNVILFKGGIIVFNSISSKRIFTQKENFGKVIMYNSLHYVILNKYLIQLGLFHYYEHSWKCRIIDYEVTPLSSNNINFFGLNKKLKNILELIESAY